MHRLSLLSLLLLSFAAAAEEPMCGVSADHDLIVRGRHERSVRGRAPVANAAALPATVREGSLYMQADDRIVPGYRPFDLEGQSLVFEPRAGAFAVRRESLRYVEPEVAPTRDFDRRLGTPWHYVTRNLSFTFPIFGRDVTQVYLTAFNEIQFDEPGEEGAMQFDTLEAAVHRQAVLSPLVITNRKPARLAYPTLYVTETENSLIVTWRSTAGEAFGYDIQAELHADGVVVYSYKSMRNVSWGAPLVSAGFDPLTVSRLTLEGRADSIGELGASFGQTAQMLDILRVDIERVGESDILALRMTLGAPADPTKFGTESFLRFGVSIDGVFGWVDVTKTGWEVTPVASSLAVPRGAAARVEGNMIELFFQQPAFQVPTAINFRFFTSTRTRSADGSNFTILVGPAPKRSGTDLSAAASGAELPLPIAEAFVLGAFDPWEVWDRLKPAFYMDETAIDAVAMYQTFFTDLIFYAGAYSTGGNAGVDGIRLPSILYGSGVKRSPGLLHMNQLTYGYNYVTELSSKVMLHEFGHRWLYFFRIQENGSMSSVLNPISAHPAAYVNTPSAFPIYGPDESSVMGGAVLTQEGEGTYRTRASNMGYSWMDLYLMGLAAPEEVAPWFYLAGTGLPEAYWPPDNIVVSGEKRDVRVEQMLAIHGARNPSTAYGQRHFRVLFVLVTENGREPTSAEVAKMNEWRALLEKNFAIATGGRAGVRTEFVVPTKRRAVR